MLAYLNKPQNALFLKFFIEELPKFEPVYQGWNSYKAQRDNDEAKSLFASTQRFDAIRAKESAKIRQCHEYANGH